MFSTGGEFSAGPSYHNWVDFRGADGAALERAIWEAYEASHKKK
jgi:hypothetical protein